MNESLLRKFCESRHRKLIVAIVTTLFGLAVLWPFTDDYFDKRESRRTLMDDLDRARQTEKFLPAFEQRVVELEEKVSLLEGRTVSAESVSQYRTNLLEIIRKAGCQMRRLEVGTPTRRPWMRDDDPLQSTAALGVTDKTPFQLERRNIKLSINGEMTSIHNLLDQLEKDKTIAYPHRLQLHSTGGRSTSATLELELWLFALVR
ncbi:MAG: hypothetical protein IH898_01120 [Planctomycetes bacterium]|nr:hypothetical protein [Planctomycetota bacterium]